MGHYNFSQTFCLTLHTVTGFLEAMSRVVVRSIYVNGMTKPLKAKSRVNHKPFSTTYNSVGSLHVES